LQISFYSKGKQGDLNYGLLAVARRSLSKNPSHVRSGMQSRWSTACKLKL